MGRQTIFPLIDRILDGHLADLLRQWKAEDMTHEQIARKLYIEHGIDVTGETVRKWFRDELPAAS